MNDSNESPAPGGGSPGNGAHLEECSAEELNNRKSKSPRAKRQDKSLRHYCRNPRCRSKLAAPTDMLWRAFCCRGCHAAFFHKRCMVCEAPLRATRKVCRAAKCRSDWQKYRETYLWPEVVKVPLRSPIKSGTKTGPAERLGFAWIRLPGDDDDWELRNREGKQVARIRQEGDGWWVARPRAIPEPPIESLDDAKRRAVTLALASLPLDANMAARIPRTNRGQTATALGAGAP